jgi:hypothetical protein
MSMEFMNLRRAHDAENATALWVEHAKKLEAELNNYKAGLSGVAAVRDAALKELALLNPKHFLLVKENRSKIYDAAYDGSMQQNQNQKS